MSIGRVLASPFRRLLDPRFGGLAQQADVQHRDLAERVDELARKAIDRDAVVEMLDQIRGELATLRADLLALPGRELAALREELMAAARADMDATRETNELLARTLGDILAETTATTMALEEALGRNSRLESTDAKGAVGPTNRNEAIVEFPDRSAGD